MCRDLPGFEVAQDRPRPATTQNFFRSINSPSSGLSGGPAPTSQIPSSEAQGPAPSTSTSFANDNTAGEVNPPPRRPILRTFSKPRKGEHFSYQKKVQFVDFEDKNESVALRNLRLAHKKMGGFQNNESSGGSQEVKQQFNPDFNQVKSEIINNPQKIRYMYR